MRRWTVWRDAILAGSLGWRASVPALPAGLKGQVLAALGGRALAGMRRRGLPCSAGRPGHLASTAPEAYLAGWQALAGPHSPAGSVLMCHPAMAEVPGDAIAAAPGSTPCWSAPPPTLPAKAPAPRGALPSRQCALRHRVLAPREAGGPGTKPMCHGQPCTRHPPQKRLMPFNMPSVLGKDEAARPAWVLRDMRIDDLPGLASLLPALGYPSSSPSLAPALGVVERPPDQRLLVAVACLGLGPHPHPLTRFDRLYISGRSPHGQRWLRGKCCPGGRGLPTHKASAGALIEAARVATMAMGHGRLRLGSGAHWEDWHAF